MATTTPKITSRQKQSAVYVTATAAKDRKSKGVTVYGSTPDQVIADLVAMYAKANQANRVDR